jgi:hypothetical protein
MTDAWGGGLMKVYGMRASPLGLRIVDVVTISVQLPTIGTSQPSFGHAIGDLRRPGPYHRSGWFRRRLPGLEDHVMSTSLS